MVVVSAVKNNVHKHKWFLTVLSILIGNLLISETGLLLKILATEQNMTVVVSTWLGTIRSKISICYCKVLKQLHLFYIIVCR